MVGDKQTAVKWVVVFAIIFVDTIWILASDFSFVSASSLKVVSIVSMLLSVAWFYRVKRPMDNFEVMCSETALLLAFSTAGAIFSYLMTSLNYPLIDEQLVHVDAALGFDWLGYVAFVNARPWLSTASSIVYITTISQIALCVIVLGLSGNITRSRQLGAAVIISGLCCITISGFLPSAGALGYLRPSKEFVALGAPIVDLDYKQVFFDLRNGAERVISLDALHGLVAFPSYHGTLSALVVISLWSIARWKWLALALNAAVILATPVDGGHHLIDALSGVMLALIAWYLAGQFSKLVPATSLESRRPPVGAISGTALPH
jgi:membrane-associated phospholipid phosphatase